MQCNTKITVLLNTHQMMAGRRLLITNMKLRIHWWSIFKQFVDMYILCFDFKRFERNYYLQLIGQTHNKKIFSIRKISNLKNHNINEKMKLCFNEKYPKLFSRTHILLKWFINKMLIHKESTIQEPLEVLKANSQTNTQTNGRPKGVPTTNPIPKAKHVSLVYSKLLDFLGIRTQCHKIFGNSSLLQWVTYFNIN